MTLGRFRGDVACYVSTTTDGKGMKEKPRPGSPPYALGEGIRNE